MSKVFRLYNIQGDNNILDWETSKVYGSQAIKEITDPDGADAKKEITSIPSPFARVDLIKTAFKDVVDLANRDESDKEYMKFDGNSIYHRMVSDTLDVAELFFNIDKFHNELDIIVWDRKRDLDINNVFGKTLDRYLKSDAKGNDPFNFSKFERIYLLKYIGPDRPASLNIIGATSPATLFFSSANDLSYVSKNIINGSDRPFDKSYQPLYKRDFEFQKYLYAFRKAYGVSEFQNHFPEIDHYMMSSSGKTCNYSFLNEEQKKEIDLLDASSISEYEPINIGENGADTLDILGKLFHKKKKDNDIFQSSNFIIKSSLYKGDRKPFVLPIEAGNTYANLKYTSDEWGIDFKAPYFDNIGINDRRLPFVQDQYPYLTISDFLEDTIVRMPYKLNDESYFDGNLKKSENSYLLPLTTTFFTYFTEKEIQENVFGIKKMFELSELAGGSVKVTLRIPIKGNNQIRFIEYNRVYFESSSPDIVNNDGALFEKKIGLGIFPLVKFPENVNKHYRIALFEKGQRDVRLKFIRENSTVETEAHIVREAKNYDLNIASKEAYVINDNFDRIRVELGDSWGVIIPKFKSSTGNKIYTFAVDFGTTNTHIEYSYVTSNAQQNSTANSFDIPHTERQLHRLHTLYADRDINGAFVHNFIPDTVGDKDEFTFPMRTVFSEWNNNDRSQNNYALANGNIPFLYEKEMFPDSYNEVRTELKWRGEEDYPLVKMFLESLFLLFRNKVLINGGKLENTKVVWFYPASMNTSRYDDFNQIWQKLYKDYFGSNVESNLIPISESTAPYRYYRKKRGAKSDVVTIDVGGGTTDVYIVEDNQPKMLLSFLFASNAVFGDAFNWDSDNNGYVNLYAERFKETLKDTEAAELLVPFDQIESRKSSPDIIAFFFSLISNKKVNGNEELNFLFKLSQNKRLKFVFILFYGSILYFIAKAMKSKGLKQPLTLAFSGNGSKTLRVLSSSNDTIGEFANLIFNGVFDSDNNKLEIKFEDEPKKATSKGGIIDLTKQTPRDIKPIKYTLVGHEMDIEASEIEKLKYEEVDEQMQDMIVNSVLEFIDFLFQLHEGNDEFLTRSLGADENILKMVLDISRDKVELSQSLKAALNTKKGNKAIEETLFFYPLIGVLHEIALKISNM